MTFLSTVRVTRQKAPLNTAHAVSLVKSKLCTSPKNKKEKNFGVLYPVKAHWRAGVCILTHPSSNSTILFMP